MTIPNIYGKIYCFLLRGGTPEAPDFATWGWSKVR